jgi:hypothetical protein
MVAVQTPKQCRCNSIIAGASMQLQHASCMSPWSMCTALQLCRHHLLLLPAYLRHTYTLQSLARGKEALLAPKSPLSVIKAATPEQQQQAAAPKPQQQQSLLSSLAMSARRLLRQGTWVGTDVPAFNGASMGWYQGERLQPTAAVSVQAPPAAGQ